MNNPQSGTFFASMPLVLTASLMASVACHALPQSQAQLPQTGAAGGNAIGQRLIANERMSWDLAIKGDTASYKALHAPDYFTVSGGGVKNRTLSEASALDSSVHFDRCDLSGFGVHFVAQNAVLITYRVKAAGFDRGKAFQLNSYASSLWMKRDGKWLNEFYQATDTPAAGGQ